MIIDRPWPWFPLPKDYPDLSAEGQREARLAVLCDQSTPEKLVLAWDFFRRMYLAQTKEEIFYKNGISESPNFHYELIRDIGTYGRNVYACPRGSAKSTITIEVSLLVALTNPFFDLSIGLATDRLVESRFDIYMAQLERNELIREDFGELKPKRGTNLWNHHILTLTNGSVIRGMSVAGRKRGGRPRWFILDDVENDPDSDSETSRMAVIERFEIILWRQIIPMLESGSSITWVGTLIDRKSFLYMATTGDDPRFDYWNRKVLKAIAYDEDDPSKIHVLWPDKWPVDVLEARREEIGDSAFHSEYLNMPISPQDRLLVVDNLKNEYSVEGEFDERHPLTHRGNIIWHDRVDAPGGRTYEQAAKPYSEIVGPMFRVLLFDYASGLRSINDYSCIAIVGFDTQMTMWVLHLWLGRAKDDTLMRLIYETGLIWRVRVLGIESVSIQNSFTEAVQNYATEQAALSDQPWRPRVFPIKYPSKESKAQRISSSMEWRFGSGRVKYPSHLAGTWPYTELYAQTRDFTMDLALLRFDDALDTLSMHKYVVKTRGRQIQRERRKPGLREQIIKNQPAVKGRPILDGISSAELSDEMTNIISHRARDRKVQPKRRKIERRRPRIKG